MFLILLTFLTHYSTLIVFAHYLTCRWFGIFDDQASIRHTEQYWESTLYFMKNYHSFWDASSSYSIAISEPVTATEFTPVGVDFYSLRERGEQFGAYGAKYPIQLYNQTGRGYFRCSDEASLGGPSIANSTAPLDGKNVNINSRFPS